VGLRKGETCLRLIGEGRKSCVVRGNWGSKKPRASTRTRGSSPKLQACGSTVKRKAGGSWQTLGGKKTGGTKEKFKRGISSLNRIDRGLGKFLERFKRARRSTRRN